MKDNSKKIGAILGPTMIAMLAAEFPLVQPTLYDSQIPPVVYLSGTLMFIAGLSIVRAHNHWKQDWTVLITISGWSFLTLGMSRMFFSTSYIQASENTTTATFIVVEGILLIIGLVITFKSYQNRKAEMLEIPPAPHR